MKSRRDFLKMATAAAGAGVMPPAIQRALAIAPDRRTGTLQDVEHVVILMQENRSFDHYFGSLRGVRGFDDARPAPLRTGRSVWHQPVAHVKTKRYQDRGLAPDADYVLPFYLNPRETTEFQAGTDHGWSSGHLSWNQGHYDQWVNQKQDVLTMGHLQRQDVSFHYALADAFTLCDAYFCSVHGDTCPNRIYLWSGTIDPRNRMGKRANGPGIEERLHTNGYSWTTYPERLQKAGVSWRVYQGGTGLAGSPTDNYTDNSLEFFSQYQVTEGASPTSPLVKNGVTNRTLLQLRDDVQKGQLPQVSWIVAPYKYCEHPDASPTDGAYFISLVLDALTSNPEVWGRTALLINYDENDGLFDHIVPPMPPNGSQAGAQGMVSAGLVASLQDEFLDLNRFPHEMHPLVPGADPGGLQPIGLGPRVPMLVVSPWSAGGWTCSEVFDHTSVLQFLEKRFGVEEPNITAWRRSVCGDLTSAFDFARAIETHDTSYPPPRPLASLHKPYSIPQHQIMPQQEEGTRPARAIGYNLATQYSVADAKAWLDLQNRGRLGAAFYVYDMLRLEVPPRRYTVQASDTLSDWWSAMEDGSYHLRVHGPNGYLAEQEARVDDGIVVLCEPDHRGQKLQLSIMNQGDQPRRLQWNDKHSKMTPQAITVRAHAQMNLTIDTSAASGWHDVTLSSVDGLRFSRRIAGRIEDGRPGITEPRITVA